MAITPQRRIESTRGSPLHEKLIQLVSFMMVDRGQIEWHSSMVDNPYDLCNSGNYCISKSSVGTKAFLPDSRRLFSGGGRSGSR